MRFLIDSQLPIALAIHLRRHGHTADHVHDLGLACTDDAGLWAYAAENEYVVVSRDEDFVYLANRIDDAGRLLWVRLMNCRNTELLAKFDLLISQCCQLLDSGQKIVELR